MRSRRTEAVLLIAIALSILNIWMLVRIMGLIANLTEILYMGGR